MPVNDATLKQKISAITASGLSIYDFIGEFVSEGPDLLLTEDELEVALREALIGLDLSGLPLRTRSKVVKENICKALGYPIPTSFKKTNPRFPGQNFDVFTQKSNNLQIWNEEVSLERRYVIIKTDENNKVTGVRVALGVIIAALDKTGTLTQKYQARFIPNRETPELISDDDTDVMKSIFFGEEVNPDSELLDSPSSSPQVGKLLGINTIFKRLTGLVGQYIEDVGVDQERNRGAELHKLVCKVLGYPTYSDSGQFPDVINQLLEVKLQTSQTIDLGLVSPDSEDPISFGDILVRHCDIRYLIVSGVKTEQGVRIDTFALTTGKDFYAKFPRFEGKITNKKLQMPLPADFFQAIPKASTIS